MGAGKSRELRLVVAGSRDDFATCGRKTIEALLKSRVHASILRRALPEPALPRLPRR